MTELADGKIAPVTAVVDDLPVEIEAPEPEPSPSKPPLLPRIGRRIIRRPSRWLNAPWPTERIVQYLTRSESCRLVAEKAHNHAVRATYPNLAHQWEMLAEQAQEFGRHVAPFENIDHE